MKKIKMTALCLSAALALSTVSTPVLAHADKGKAKVKEKIKSPLNWISQKI